jgi:hypothetical protein
MMLAAGIGGGDQLMGGVVHVNIRLNDARRIVLQLLQSWNENVGPSQRVRGGNLVGRLPRLGQSLAVKFTSTGSRVRKVAMSVDKPSTTMTVAANNADDLDLQTQASKHPIHPELLSNCAITCQRMERHIA